MTNSMRQGAWTITVSFVVAAMLTILPLPQGVEVYRPEWVALVLIYWCIAVPERVGIGIGWCVGLLLDVLKGALLGQHALALAVVAYLAQRLHRRIRFFPVWQQALSVLVLIATEQMLILWVKGITGQAPGTWKYWLPSLVSMLLWPWIFILLRDLRRRFVTSK